MPSRNQKGALPPPCKDSQFSAHKGETTHFEIFLECKNATVRTHLCLTLLAKHELVSKIYLTSTK
jgi:hypothetical protein